MHMHGETYSMQQIRAKRERGRRMAKARWAQDRARRDALARLESASPLLVGRQILQRIVVIDREQHAREIVRYSGDSAREWARKKRSVGI